MVYKNSLDAYHQIKAEGLLSKRRLQVYEIIAKHGPINPNQIYQNYLHFLPQHSVTPRLIELVRQGVIREEFSKPCPLTGHMSGFFVSTNNLPKKLEVKKRRTRKDLEQRYDAYRAALVAIWKDKRAPVWVRDIIRENTKHLKKEK